MAEEHSMMMESTFLRRYRQHLTFLAYQRERAPVPLRKILVALDDDQDARLAEAKELARAGIEAVYFIDWHEAPDGILN
jgi:hypothetical protein